MGFSRQEYWSGFPCPPPGDLPDPGIEPMSLMSLALAGRFFTISTTYELERLRGLWGGGRLSNLVFFFFFKHLLAGKISLQKRALNKLPTELRVTAHCLQSQTQGHWYSGKLSLIRMLMIWEDCGLSPLRTTSKDAASRESLKEKGGSNLS